MRTIKPLSFLLLFLMTLVSQAHATEITVASYNVENFFDIYDDPYIQDDGPKAGDEVERLAAAIQDIDADIMGLCEIENLGVLDALIMTYLPQAGYDYRAVQPTNSDRGIQLGIISRYPITSLTSYRFNELTLPGAPRTWRFARDLLHAVIDVEGTEVHVLMVHFKSKRDSQGDPQSGMWRLAEATFARQVIDGLLANDPNARIAIMGDFNDTIETDTIQTFLGDGTMQSMHEDMPESQRITYLNEPYRSQIDFILTSPTLSAERSGSGIEDDEALTQGSDHAPIWATFDLPDE